MAKINRKHRISDFVSNIQKKEMLHSSETEYQEHI